MKKRARDSMISKDRPTELEREREKIERDMDRNRHT